MKKQRVLSTVLLAVLLSATPAFADTQLTRYHFDSNFNCVIGAEFEASWPCDTDWSSWGSTSNYKEIIENWEDCEENPMSTTCWVFCCNQWVQVTCP